MRQDKPLLPPCLSSSPRSPSYASSRSLSRLLSSLFRLAASPDGSAGAAGERQEQVRGPAQEIAGDAGGRGREERRERGGAGEEWGRVGTCGRAACRGCLRAIRGGREAFRWRASGEARLARGAQAWGWRRGRRGSGRAREAPESRARCRCTRGWRRGRRRPPWLHSPAASAEGEPRPAAPEPLPPSSWRSTAGCIRPPAPPPASPPPALAASSAQRVPVGRVEPGGHEHELRVERASHRHHDALERHEVLRVPDLVVRPRDVDVEAPARPHANFVRSACARVEVPVLVAVQGDDEDSLQPELALRNLCRHGHVVEEAEPHDRLVLRVVPWRSHKRRPVRRLSSKNSPADLSHRPCRHTRAQGRELVAVGVGSDLRAAPTGDASGGVMYLLPVLERVHHQHLLLCALPPLDLRASPSYPRVHEVLVHGGDAVRALGMVVALVRPVEGHVSVVGEDGGGGRGLREAKRLRDDRHGDAFRFQLHPPHVRDLTKVLPVLPLGLDTLEDHVGRYRVLLAADVSLACKARLCAVDARVIIACAVLLVSLLRLLRLLRHHAVGCLSLPVRFGLQAIDVWEHEA
eukprot:748802-Hanusia_phi.AAC.7